MDNSTDQNVLEPKAAAEDLRGLERVRAIIKALAKFITGKKTYAKNNPTLVKFSKEFDASFRAFFEEEEELVLTIEKYEILWHEEVVYRNDKIDESLAFLLYKDGIGEIAFQNSVSVQQLERFVDLLKDEIHNFSPDEDIVTKFWRSDFEDISYRVMDEYLVGEFGDGQSGQDQSRQQILQGPDHPDIPSLADKGRVIVKPTDPLESISEYLHGMLGATGDVPHEEREGRFQDMLASFFTISSEELKLCQEEVREEIQRDALAQFLDVILDFTLMQDNPSAVRDVSNVVECIVDFAVAEGRLAVLTEMLTTIRRFIEERSAPEALTPFFKNLEGRFYETSLLLKLGQDLERLDKHAEDLFAFYRTVGKRAIPTICSLLEDLKGPRLHEAACDTLVVIGREEIPQIVEKLNLDNPRIANDVVYLIKAMDTDQVPALVRQLMYYPDRTVRVEIINYLAERPGEDTAILLVELMDDEDKHIRLKALSAAENFAHPIVANKVSAMAFDKELDQKGPDEQEQIFKVAGKLGGEDLLPRIREMLDKKALFGFGKGQAKNSKLLAVRALENIPGPESAGILDDLASDKNTLIKAKAQRALRANEKQTHEQVHQEGSAEGSEDTEEDKNDTADKE